ncbi:MAG TPA: hypothetical protein EYF95_05270 [Flavobacteriales bacterium]|jgi:hypothetical protein|nr:hypothetical protein [Flavobacteriales bacterium]
MKPSEVNVGDLIITEYGLARVMEFLAPAFISCVIVTPTGIAGADQGEWIYLRGYNLEKAKLVTENDTYLTLGEESNARNGI